MQLFYVTLALVAMSNSGVDAKPPSKIVGGKQTSTGEIPGIAMIRHIRSVNSTFAAICGGTIISNRHILTAAHCFNTDPADPEDLHHPRWYRVIPSYNISSPTAKEYEIEEVYSHPNYVRQISIHTTIKADIAVVKLKEAIEFTKSSRPIEMAWIEPATYATGYIYGWGGTRANADVISESLHGLTVVVFSSRNCRILFPENVITDDQLCITHVEYGSATRGDSGGPLTVDGQLSGVISSGPGAYGSEPALVINVAYYRTWIDDVMRGRGEAKTYFAKETTTTTARPTTTAPKRIEEPKRHWIHDELSSWDSLFPSINIKHK